MRVVIMVAMEEEAQYLRPLLADGAQSVSLPGIRTPVSRGLIDGIQVRESPPVPLLAPRQASHTRRRRAWQVDIVISGIGTVFAASATTATLLSGPCAAVLSCGCSGAHVHGQRRD